jgi:hypothetical protein
MTDADYFYELFFKDSPEYERPERCVVDCGLRPLSSPKWTDEMVVDLMKIVSDDLVYEIYGQTKDEFLISCNVNPEMTKNI